MSEKRLTDIRRAFVATVTHLFINDIADRTNAGASRDRDISIVDAYVAQCNFALSQYTGANVGKLLQSTLDYYTRNCSDRADTADIFRVLAERTAMSHMRADITHERKMTIAGTYAKAMVREMHRLAIDHAKNIMHPKNRINPEYLSEIRTALETTFDLTKQAIRKSITSPAWSDESERLRSALIESVKAQSRAELDLKMANKRIAELEDALSKSMELIDVLKKQGAPKKGSSSRDRSSHVPDIDESDTHISMSANDFGFSADSSSAAGGDDDYSVVQFDDNASYAESSGATHKQAAGGNDLPREYTEFERNLQNINRMWS